MCVLLQGRAQNYYYLLLSISKVVQAWLANWSLRFAFSIRYFYTGNATELFYPFTVAGSFV